MNKHSTYVYWRISVRVTGMKIFNGLAQLFENFPNISNSDKSGSENFPIRSRRQMTFSLKTKYSKVHKYFSVRNYQHQ